MFFFFIQSPEGTPVINLQEAAKDTVIKTWQKRASTLIIIMFFVVLLSAGYLMFSERIKFYYRMMKSEQSVK